MQTASRQRGRGCGPGSARTGGSRPGFRIRGIRGLGADARNEISGPSAFGALCAPPTSPSKGCGPRGQSHSVHSPPDNNEQPKSYSFGCTDGLHSALNVLQYQRVEGVTVLERRRRKTTKRQSSRRSVRHRQSFYRALYFTLINPLT